MGDDHPCSMEAVGTIRIRMFDGMVRELKGVRYISQLKRNLISIGALEASGMVISVRDGDLRMIRGSMAVMKGVRRDNLYYLKGSTITDQVETSSPQMMVARRSGRERSDRKKKSLCELLQRWNRWKVLLPASWKVDTAFWTRRR